MNALTALVIATANRLPGEGGHVFDDQGYTTHSAWFPERAELIYGSISFAVVAALAIKFKVPAMVKKGFAARTEKIQAELDASAAARSNAEGEATRIRQSLGNIDAERQQLLADAEVQAEALLTDGRARLDAEVAELEAKAVADIASVGSRSSDELRAEIATLSSTAADHVVSRSLDDATQQSLIEDFIANVGRTGVAAGASS